MVTAVVQQEQSGAVWRRAFKSLSHFQQDSSSKTWHEERKYNTGVRSSVADIDHVDVDLDQILHFDTATGPEYGNSKAQ